MRLEYVLKIRAPSLGFRFRKLMQLGGLVSSPREVEGEEFSL